MTSFSPSLFTLLRRLFAALVVVGLLATACGGSDGTGTTETVDDTAADSSDNSSVDPADLPQPTETPTSVVVPTTAPPPTATPLPTSTAEPLEAPTPTTVLLTTAFTNSSRVTTVGIGKVFFGTTPEQAAAAAMTTWVELPRTSGNCYRVTPADGPEGVTLWVVDGFVERVDIEHPDLRTPSQLGLGNTAAELQGQLQERLTIEATGDGGQVATFTPTDPGDRDFRIMFELEDDTVVRYRSGRINVVDRAEASC